MADTITCFTATPSEASRIAPDGETKDTLAGGSDTTDATSFIDCPANSSLSPPKTSRSILGLTNLLMCGAGGQLLDRENVGNLLREINIFPAYSPHIPHILATKCPPQHFIKKFPVKNLQIVNISSNSLHFTHNQINILSIGPHLINRLSSAQHASCQNIIKLLMWGKMLRKC